MGNSIMVNKKDTDEKRNEANHEDTDCFSLISDLACIVSDDGHFKQLNPTLATTLGYSTAELLKLPFIEPLHPEDIKPTRREIEKCVIDRPFSHFLTRCRCKDGSYKFFEWRTILAQEDHLIYAAATDITEHKRMEELLHGYRLLSQYARDIILFIRRSDDCILEANDAAVKAYGYGKEDLLSLTIRDLREQSTRGLIESQMASCETVANVFESVHQRSNGSAFPVEVSSIIVSFVEIVHCSVSYGISRSAKRRRKG